MTDPDFATLRHLREEVVRLQAELRAARSASRDNLLRITTLESQLRALLSPARRMQESARAC